MGDKGLIREAQVNVFLLPFGEEEKKKTQQAALLKEVNSLRSKDADSWHF